MLEAQPGGRLSVTHLPRVLPKRNVAHEAHGRVRECNGSDPQGEHGGELQGLLHGALQSQRHPHTLKAVHRHPERGGALWIPVKAWRAGSGRC